MKIEKLQALHFAENKPNLDPTKLVIEALQKLNKASTREETIAQIIKTYPELWKCFLSVYSQKTALSSIGSFLFQLQNNNSFYFVDQNKKYQLKPNLKNFKFLDHQKNNSNNNNNNKNNDVKLNPNKKDFRQSANNHNSNLKTISNDTLLSSRDHNLEQSGNNTNQEKTIPNKDQNSNPNILKMDQLQTQLNAKTKDENTTNSSLYGESVLKALGIPSSKDEIIEKGIEMFPKLWKNYTSAYSKNVAKLNNNNNNQYERKEGNHTSNIETKQMGLAIKAELIKQNTSLPTNFENNTKNHDTNNISNIDNRINYTSINKSNTQNNVSHTINMVNIPNTTTHPNTKNIKNNGRLTNLRNTTNNWTPRNTRNSKKIQHPPQLLDNKNLVNNLKKQTKKEKVKLNSNAKKRKILNQLIDERMGSREKGWIYGKSIIKALGRPCSRSEIIDKGKDLFSILWSCYHDTYSNLSEAESFFGRILIPSNIKSHGVNLKDGLYFIHEKQDHNNGNNNNNNNNNNNYKMKKNKKKTKEKSYVIKTKLPASEKKRRTSKRLKNKKKIVKFSEKDPKITQTQNKPVKQEHQTNSILKEAILNNINNNNNQQKQDNKIIKENTNKILQTNIQDRNLNQTIIENLNINRNENETINTSNQTSFKKQLVTKYFNNQQIINPTEINRLYNDSVPNNQKNNSTNQINTNTKENHVNNNKQNEEFNQKFPKNTVGNFPNEERKRTHLHFNSQPLEEQSQQKTIKSKKYNSQITKKRRRNKKRKKYRSSSCKRNYHKPTNSPYSIIYSDKNIIILEEEDDDDSDEEVAHEDIYKNWILNAYQTLFQLNLKPKTYKNIFNEISRGNQTIIHQLNNINRDSEKKKLSILQLLLQINPIDK
ncbi:hypothetical protein M0812_10528 [Anaeramoeba flamelloides]|uniref:Uncharacterized protein n=1 Tax=Anaeramoeba flamelloides TaxID=1746091 RepID=A0AAV7ZXK7_9EUKA|nr:hypothetical protein M0812_10528 [Anaeramoeba flamelloides]